MTKRFLWFTGGLLQLFGATLMVDALLSSFDMSSIVHVLQGIVAFVGPR